MISLSFFRRNLLKFAERAKKKYAPCMGLESEIINVALGYGVLRGGENEGRQWSSEAEMELGCQNPYP